MNDELSQEEKSEPAEPVKEAVPVTEDRRVQPEGWLRWFWIAVAVFSAFYVFLPEPSDAIPFLGWLDEGTAVLLLAYALERLGVHIPFLTRLAGGKKKEQP
jgi:hypothetical protein